MTYPHGDQPGRYGHPGHDHGQPSGQYGQPAQPHQQQPGHGPPPQHAGQPHYQQPPPRRKSKLVPWLIAGGVALLLCCGGGLIAVAVVTSSDDGTSGSADVAEDGAPAEDAPGIGEPARDGKFEFTITEIETGVASIGDDLVGEDAQGQFVLVHLTVANIGDEAQLFDGSSQKLYDAEGREHSNDGSAAIVLPESESFLNEINPGNSVTGTVVFDIPADATPASIELHDSPFSGGVLVDLRQ